MVVYIAHPYRNNPEENLKAVNSYILKAINMNYVPICALKEIGHLLGQIDENLVMDLCYRYIDISNIVWFCGNWETSEGCRLELAYARSKNKKIEFLKQGM